jgi:hypothetical protein
MVNGFKHNEEMFKQMSPYYANLALSVDTAWNIMLAAYHAYYP